MICLLRGRMITLAAGNERGIWGAQLGRGERGGSAGWKCCCDELESGRGVLPNMWGRPRAPLGAQGVGSEKGVSALWILSLALQGVRSRSDAAEAQPSTQEAHRRLATAGAQFKRGRNSLP